MKRKDTVRILRAAIVGTEDGQPAVFREAKQCFAKLADTIQVVTNDYWTQWLLHHYQAGSPALIRRWIDADMGWVKTPKAQREPKQRVTCPVAPMPPELGRKLYAAIRTTYPTLGTKTLGLVMNVECKRLVLAKSTKSAYPRWMRILAGKGEFPSSARAQPIPFSASNAKIVPPATDDPTGTWILELRFEGEPGKKKMTVHRLKIKTVGYKLASLRDSLWKISSGEYKWCGSNLVVRDGLWYGHICYQMPLPEPVVSDPAKVAYLSPAADRPVHLWVDSYPLWLGRSGADVAHVRSQLVARRWSNAQAYHFASSARKGHGINRALAWREPLRRRWLDFRKTYNERLASDAIKRVVAEGIGRLVFLQPVGSRRDTRYLATAGCGGREDLREWDWTQLAGLLGRRCQENGVELEIRRCGREGFRAVKRAQG